MSVTIGGIALTDWATPNKIPFGGKHKLNIHRMIGGQRVVDATGPDAADISFTGRFRGPGAIGKALALDAMRNSGRQVPLMWLGLFYMVVIEEFKAETEKAFEVPYTINCVVVLDPAAAVAGLVSSLDAMVSGDIAAVAGLASLPSFASAAVSGVASAIAGVGSLTGLSIPAMAPVLASAVAASSTLAAGMAAADNALNVASPDAADPSLMAAWLTNASVNSNAQAALVAASGYVGRVALNLTNGTP